MTHSSTTTGTSYSSGLNSKPLTMPSFSKPFFNQRHTIPLRRSSFLILLITFLLLLLPIVFLKPFHNNRCLNTNPRSVRVVWDHGTAATTIGGGNDRHKVMAFVGIQTGFRSVGRRESLRKTWFPSDPNGLQRY